MAQTSAAEDYLEAILILQQKGAPVRSVDVATQLKVSRASVSAAMRNLRRDGSIEMNPAHEISLTERGRATAEAIYERHQFFYELLLFLQLDPQTAARDACRIEHAISAESFVALKHYLNKRGFPHKEKHSPSTEERNSYERSYCGRERENGLPV